MSFPNGAHEWAVARGISPFHPATWSAEDRAAYRTWKIARFREYVRWHYRTQGMADILRRQNGQAFLIRRLREQAQEAVAPAPMTDTYAVCPCHPTLGTPERDELGYASWPQEREPDPTPEETGAWVEAAPAARVFARPALAEAFAIIERANPARTKEGHAA